MNTFFKLAMILCMIIFCSSQCMDNKPSGFEKLFEDSEIKRHESDRRIDYLQSNKKNNAFVLHVLTFDKEVCRYYFNIVEFEGCPDNFYPAGSLCPSGASEVSDIDSPVLQKVFDFLEEQEKRKKNQ